MPANFFMFGGVSMQSSMTIDLQYVGYKYFLSKDKSKTFYILQFLICQENETNTQMQTGVINVFVTEAKYKEFLQSKKIGQKYKVKITVDLINDRIQKEVL